MQRRALYAKWMTLVIAVGGLCGIVGTMSTAWQRNQRDEAMIRAVKAGDRPQVARLLGQGANPNIRVVPPSFSQNLLDRMLALCQVYQPSTNWIPLLIEALKQNDLEIARLLVEKGADPNVYNADGVPALLLAAEHVEGRQGERNLVKALLDHGANIEVHRADKQTVLFRALHSASLEICTLMIERGANLNTPDSHGETILDAALERAALLCPAPFMDPAAERRAEFENILRVKHAVGTYTTSNTPQTLAQSVETVEDRHALVRLLLARGANVETRAAGVDTPLFRAARLSDDFYFRLLMQQRVDIDARDSSGRTPLMVALDSGHTNYARLLIAAGADLMAQDKAQHTALDYIGGAHDPNILHEILNASTARSSFFSQPEERETALRLAVRCNDYAAAERLLGEGANANMRDQDGKTLLMLALGERDSQREIRFLRLLLAHGADIDARDYAGHSALYLAI